MPSCTPAGSAGGLEHEPLSNDLPHDPPNRRNPRHHVQSIDFEAADDTWTGASGSGTAVVRQHASECSGEERA